MMIESVGLCAFHSADNDGGQFGMMHETDDRSQDNVTHEQMLICCRAAILLASIRLSNYLGSYETLPLKVITC